MGGDILGVGISGLLAFQRSLNTIGHNISNVNTEGYSRQRVDLATRYPNPSGIGFMGNGVEIAGVRRIFDEYAARQLRDTTTGSNFYQTYESLASQVDNLLADQDAGLASALTDFFDSVQGVANDPTSNPARAVMLTNAQSLVDRFETMEQWLAELRQASNGRIESQVAEINDLARSIANLNQQIVVARGLGGGNEPNDMLDQRDLLLDKLAAKIGVTTVPQDDGSINVFIGNGQSLVLGFNAMQFEARPDPDDPSFVEVTYVDPGAGALIPITKMITGGELGGVIAFREEVLKPSFNQLGRLAVGLAMSFNDQHRKGMDLNNALGGDFFVEPTPEVAASVYNTGTGTVSVTFDRQPGINDISDLVATDYQLTYLAGGDYELKNLENGQTTILAAASGPVYAVDGLSIDVSGWTPAVGDEIFIRPYRGASRQIALAFDDPNLVAAAGPLRTGPNPISPEIANQGEGQIGEARILDPTDPLFLTPVNIDFRTSAAGTAPYADEYSVDGGVTWLPYTDPTTITMNGWEVDITGIPWDGDRFTVEPNTNGAGDNTNALALAELQITGTMVGGTATYHDVYSSLVVDVGNKTRQAQINQQAQEALQSQARAVKESISGVNLDEEAANLMRFQQAYTAAAQVIATADTLFQTLINAVRR